MPRRDRPDTAVVRVHQSVTALHAVEAAPALTGLLQRLHVSNVCLQLVLPLVPRGLHASLQAGPLDGGTWCLLVRNNAVAARMRQLLPALAAHLRVKGQNVTEIRLRVLPPKPP